MLNEALGMVEIEGLVGTIGVADVMTKATNVALTGYEKIGFSLAMTMIRGDVGAVKAPVDTGVVAMANVGQVVSQHVIPRPHTDVEKILPRLLQDASRCISVSVVGIQTSGRGRT